MSAAVSNGREPPKLWISFPATRYYMRQLIVNPNLAFKTFLHTTMPFAFKNPKETRKDKEALKAKGKKAAKLDRYKFSYKQKKHLATGGFGKIYKANVLLKTGPGSTRREICALKIIPLQSTGLLSRLLGQKHNNAVDEDAAQNELVILKNLQGNDFIMEYKYDTLKNGKLIIVTEFCSGRDLADILERSQMLPEHYFIPGCGETTKRIPCHLVRFILAPMFDALAHMHEKSYIHRDIKPQNILVDSRGVPKLCDFGLAVYMDKDKGYCSGDIHMAGSSYYMAPESVCRQPYTTTLDTWQMGITMLVLAYGWGPYHFMKQRVHWEQRSESDTSAICYFYRDAYRDNNSGTKFVDKVVRSFLGIGKKDKLDSEENDAWSDFKAFVGALMKFDVRQRPSCKNVLQHEYVADPLAEWKTMEFMNFRETFEEWQAILDAC